MRAGLVIASLLIVTALGGCWKAAAPLMPEAAKDPIPVAAQSYRTTTGLTYTLLARSGNDLTVRVRSAGIASGPFKGEPSSNVNTYSADLIHAAKAGEQVYLLQIQAQPKWGDTEYGVIKIRRDGVILAYELLCEGAAARSRGTKKDQSGNCVFSSYNSMKENANNPRLWKQMAVLTPVR
ncbi:MAG: hypothetical protein QM682_16375 [Paracoccus sp. (in: a-proteobacteria)]|uniref:hypothetical protein n=1 Tax=Paracoccus sp. TaxID=267 RepID=UPI0039E5FE5A